MKNTVPNIRFTRNHFFFFGTNGTREVWIKTMYKCLSGGLRVGVQNKQADGLKVEEHEQNTEMQ